MKSKMLLVLWMGLSLNPAFAEQMKAKVVKIRGKVTQLRPGDMISRKVSLGDELKADTSIVTGPHSFVRIQMLTDKTFINIGPQSKALINVINKQKGGIVSLLKGKIRTKFKKKNKNQRLYIKTRSAALGVRGTEFQTLYNPSNKITSLVTFRGDVAMVKDSSHDLHIGGEKPTKEISRDLDDKVELRDKLHKEKDSFEELESKLKGKEAVSVKQGQYSGTVKSLDRTSLAVKLNPVQLNSLYKNVDMLKKGRVKKSELAELDVTKLKKDELLIRPVSQEAPEEGVFDKSSGRFAPKAGGILDLETGAYIAPNKDSSFDLDTGTFVPKNVGYVDKDTGQYLPPRGLKLDPLKGFIPINKFKNNKKLVALSGNLNKTMSKDILLGDAKKEATVERFNRFSTRELMSKDTLSLTLRPSGETLQVKNDTISGTRDIKSESAQFLDFKWEHASGQNWQVMTGFSFKTVRYDSADLSGIQQNSSDLFQMELGLRRYLTSRWNFNVRVRLEQEQFLDHVSENSTTVTQVSQITLPKVLLGFEGDLIRSGKFALQNEVYLIGIVPKEAGSSKVDSGLGFLLSLRAKYWFSKKYWSSLGGFIRQEAGSLSGTGFTADYSRSSGGIGLGAGVTF